MFPSHLLRGVERQGLERVDRNQDGSDVRVDPVLSEARAQDVEERVLVEIVQHRQVIHVRVHGLWVAQAAIRAFPPAEDPSLLSHPCVRRGLQLGDREKGEKHEK